MTQAGHLSRFSPEQQSIAVRYWGNIAYEPMWQQMLEFTAKRTADTPDELWVCEHPPVYTLGQAGKAEHLLSNNGIPLVKVDRGGQITYHGPGQVVIYVMFDLVRRQLKVHDLVTRIEQAMIDFLAAENVLATRVEDAPGVYIKRETSVAKIGSLGIRVRKNGCYHGLSLNVDMDLTPFSAINPCGYAGLAVTQTRDLGISLTSEQVAKALVSHLLTLLEKK